jgi:DNA repair protein RadD
VGYELRPYQETIIHEARSLMGRGARSLLITAPTGSGKTVLTAHMLNVSARKGLRSWFIVHRRELVQQSSRTFQAVGVPHGVQAAGFSEDIAMPVQVGSVQTLATRMSRLSPPDFIIWDECHHIAAGSWSKIHEQFSKAYHVGLTATPQRLDGTGLGKWFSEIVQGPSVSWLIENRYLSPYRAFVPSRPDIGGVRTKMGDFVRSELELAIDKPTITGNVIHEYSKRAHGKRAVVFCVSIEHSKHVAAQFEAAGIRALHIDGETDLLTRDRSLREFAEGKVKVLCNVELFGEGFDLPSIEVAILLRPTQSLGLYLQQVGRSLRPSPGKSEALILDHAGNIERHGLPDEQREWSLLGRARSRKKDSAPDTRIRVCGSCFAAQLAGALHCNYCGHAFPIKAREIREVDGELSEIDQEALRKKARQAQGEAYSLNELIEIGKQRKYRYPYRWARHVFQARQRQKLMRGRG